MKLQHYIGLCAALVIPAVGQAQTTELSPIDFETENYKAIGVYDTWPGSPFRTGQLQGNAAVVDNFLTDEANSSAKILGVQRSRLGSNTFGVRIDLKEPLATTTTQRFMHVMIHKPVEGRVMLIGLGKRTDRPEQSAEVEQFWSYPMSDVKTGEWFDAVFPVKTNNGVEIHSLVIVPNCEAPHTLSEDFVAYIDDIEFNDDLRPRIGGDDYPVNFSKDADWGRTDRYLNSFTLTGGSNSNTAITVPSNPRRAFSELFDKPFQAKAGDNVTPSFNYSGTWMHGYVYLDRGSDGEFSYAVNDDNTIGSGSDLMSYSAYRAGETGNFRNSAGDILYESMSQHNTMKMPAFTVPADLKPGFYRMRFKIDWNSVDPGGNYASGNNILNNGGGVWDALINVHGDEVNVTNDNRNGEVTTADGKSLSNYKHPFGQALSIKMVPSNGFDYNGIRVRHGYNLHADSLVHGNPQYRDDFFYVDAFDSNDCFTIPAEYIDGDVLIEGLFVEQGNAKRRVNLTYNIEVNGQIIATQNHQEFPGEPYPQPDALDIETSEEYYTLTGLPEGTVTEDNTVITLTLQQNLPFETSENYDNATWYLMTLTKDYVYLIHNSSLSYISLPASGTTKPSADNYAAQWAFVGNVLDGFTILNREAGSSMILSSSTNTSANTGGATYPRMMTFPVASGYNTYWIPTVSNDLGVDNSFYLHQKGLANNRMNSRDNRLAYWTGGADAGSTFTCEKIATTSAIGSIGVDGGEVRYFNLQGVEVPAENLQPGIYVCRRGAEVIKILVK